MAVLGLKALISVEPAKRATRDFEQSLYDILLPVPEKAPISIPNILSRPIFMRRDYGFVYGMTPIPRSVEDLEGRRVLLTAQYRYHPSITGNGRINLVYGNHDEDNMRALARGRAEVFVVEEFSGLRAAAALSGIRYDRSSPLSQTAVFMAVQGTSCGQLLAAEMDAALSDVINGGFYRRAMGLDANW